MPPIYLSRLAALTLLLLVPLKASSDETENLAKSLVELRGQVEMLSADLEFRKQELRDRIRAIAIQKADLEAQIQKEKLRVIQVEQAVSRQKEIVEQAGRRGEILKPMLLDAIDSVVSYIESALPFRTGERRSELESLASMLEDGTVTPQKAAVRLWTFLEDELRMTRESGLYRQTIRLDGTDVLSDVVRIGMVMLFFRTSDGVAGYAFRNDQGWEYRRYHDQESVDAVAALFSSFKKNIRVGYFQLPFALPAASGAK